MRTNGARVGLFMVLATCAGCSDDEGPLDTGLASDTLFFDTGIR